VKIAVISDIHGNLPALEAVINHIDQWQPDQVVVNGDIVNRGPRSLETLRWARRTADRLGDRFAAVIGNHDLHLVAAHRGWAKLRGKDTFADVLDAPDGAGLIEWLAQRPVLHRDGEHILVHAGLRYWKIP